MINVPSKLTGHDFEALMLSSALREEKAGTIAMERTGVMMSVQNGQKIGIASRQDFDGVVAFPPGRQFNIEAKVCGETLFPMNPDKIKGKQVAHMLKRARFGAVSFLVIHFTERKSVRSHHPAFTVGIPILPENPRWQNFVDACDRFAAAKKEWRKAEKAGTPTEKPKFDAQPGFARDEAVRLGTVIPWVVPPRCKNALPDLLAILDPTGVLRGLGTPSPPPQESLSDFRLSPE